MIGIFDSGVGGLSVLKEILKLNPEISFSYFADNAHVPYGEKSADFILERSLKITDFLLTRGAKAIVIACNTATAVAAERVRNNLSIPVVAVEPPVKPAALNSKNSVIGVLATSVTLESKRFNSLVKSYAADCKIIKRVSNDLVPLIENGLLASSAASDLLASIVDNFISQQVDVVVLGSTHFYFLSEKIEQLSSGSIKCFSPSEPTARRLTDTIKEKNIDISSGDREFCVSGSVERFDKSLATIFSEQQFVSQQALV